jgi:anti-sigma regulatory factor (Ser/Thr protein kinase)/ABC-type transporter Mla MlaB component
MGFQHNSQATSVVLPKTVGVGHLASLIRAVSQIAAGAGDVELDCSQVNFVDPLGMTLLAAMLEPLSAQRRVSMVWLKTDIAGYLERMDFFNGIAVEGVNIPQNRSRHDQRSKLLEITRVVDHHKSEEIADQLANAVVTQILGRSPKPVNFNEPDIEYDQHYRPLRYALSELLENALTHARREGRFDSSVWVAAQYYQQDGGRIQVAVVDNGCGFLATLKNHAELRTKSHAEAIRTALKPKVSCNRDMGPFGQSVNEGVGLTTTARIAKKTGGSVHIVSGDAFFADEGANGVKRRDQVQQLAGTWNGVAISATFVCQKLPSIRIDQLLPPVERPPALEDAVVFRFDD